jgi:transcriptional regulator with XRE-family HTH domain
MIKSNTDRAEFARLLGARIKAARLALGYSYGQVAEIADIDPGTLTRIEKGEREPSAWVLSRLAPTLGVTVDSLIGVG